MRPQVCAHGWGQGPWKWRGIIEGEWKFNGAPPWPEKSSITRFNSLMRILLPIRRLFTKFIHLIKMEAK